MQVLGAYARDPGFRPEFAEKLAALVPMYNGQIEASAGGVFSRELVRVASGGDGRYGQMPSAADLAATRAADLPLLLRGALAGPADVVIVGDVSVADAVKATQATFGAGAAGPRVPEVQVHVAMAPGSAQPDVVTHGGRADQAYYGEL
jgi:zinc protease